MYDNLDFGLKKDDVSNIDFLNEVPQYLFSAEQINFENGTVIKGTLGNDKENNYFEVSVSEAGVNLRNGSLCKYHLGDNFKTMGRSDTKRAIEQLSDTLHLPIDKARMYRIDIAQNFILKHPVDVYFNHLGEMKIGRSVVKRVFDERGSLYYYYRNGKFIMYDKLKEQKEKRRYIDELYQNRNVLRIEQRHTTRLPKTFNVERVTAAMLYDETFYIDIINRWRDAYRAIKKINDISLNFEDMRGKKDFTTMCILSTIQSFGGELALMEQVKEAQKKGKLSKKAAFDIRQSIIEAANNKDSITAANDAILELDKKVNEAVKFYR